MLMREHLDPASLIIIVITLVLFGLALWEKGLTHDLLLEAGVFLVSAKLVLAAYRSSLANQELQRRLEGLGQSLTRIEQQLLKH